MYFETVKIYYFPGLLLHSIYIAIESFFSSTRVIKSFLITFNISWFTYFKVFLVKVLMCFPLEVEVYQHFEISRIQLSSALHSKQWSARTYLILHKASSTLFSQHFEVKYELWLFPHFIDINEVEEPFHTQIYTK